MSETSWFVVERLLPVALVAASVGFLVLAAIAQVFDDPSAWTLFGVGCALWLAGIGWGLLVNRVGPALARTG